MNSEDDTSVGTDLCYKCDSIGELYITDFGLRCENCRLKHEEPSYNTYLPSFREPNTKELDKQKGTVGDYLDSLPDITMCVELHDETQYRLSKIETVAVFIEFGDMWEEFGPMLADKVEEHYNKMTEPTKFSSYAPWGSSNFGTSCSDYKDHSELAPVVAYSTLRSAMMSIAMNNMSDDQEDCPDIISINGDEISKYSKEGKVTVEGVDEL